jgi:hypothetical protein
MYFPEKAQWRERLCYTLRKWAHEESSLEIQQFCDMKHVSRTNLYEWRDKFPEVRKAMDEVMLTLGARRRIGALTRKYDSKMALMDLYRYDPEWREVDSYQQSLKGEDNDDES